MGSPVEFDAERTLVLTVKMPVFGKRSHLEKTQASVARVLKAVFGDRVSVERATTPGTPPGGPVSGVQIHQTPPMPPEVVADAFTASWAARREMERRRA